MGHLWVKNCVSCSRYTPKVWLARGSWNKNSLTWEGFKRNLRKGWWFSHKMLLSDSFVSFKLGYLRVRFEAISRGSSFFKPIKWPNHQSPNCFSFFRRWFLQFAWIIFFPLVFHIARVFFHFLPPMGPMADPKIRCLVESRLPSFSWSHERWKTWAPLWTFFEVNFRRIGCFLDLPETSERKHPMYGKKAHGFWPNWLFFRVKRPPNFLSVLGKFSYNS